MVFGRRNLYLNPSSRRTSELLEGISRLCRSAACLLRRVVTVLSLLLFFFEGFFFLHEEVSAVEFGGLREYILQEPVFQLVGFCFFLELFDLLLEYEIVVAVHHLCEFVV